MPKSFSAYKGARSARPGPLPSRDPFLPILWIPTENRLTGITESQRFRVINTLSGSTRSRRFASGRCLLLPDWSTTAAALSSKHRRGNQGDDQHSRVKQQQEIDRLNAENGALHEQIGTLNRVNREEKARHERAEQQLQAKLDRIEHWLPDTQALIRWSEYCRDMGLSESGACEIIAMNPLYVSGELHAGEYSRRFDVSNSEIRLQRDPNGPGSFQLFIDRKSAHAWFRRQYVEFMTRLGCPPSAPNTP